MNVYFHFFNENKQQPRNSDDTYDFSLTINNIPRPSATESPGQWE